MNEYGTFVDSKVLRGYFQVDIALNAKHPSFKKKYKTEWSSDAFRTMGDALEGLHKEGETLVKRVTGCRLIESTEEDSMPSFYVVDPTNHAVASLDVKFHDYSNETLH